MNLVMIWPGQLHASCESRSNLGQGLEAEIRRENIHQFMETVDFGFTLYFVGKSTVYE
jgi:hypothetical protein